MTAHNGMRTVVWQQQVDGIPVYNTILKANLTKDGALVTMGSHFMQDAAAATQMDAAHACARSWHSRRWMCNKAVSLAAANLGDAVAPEQAAATVRAARGRSESSDSAAPQLSDTMAQLSWLPMARTRRG